MSTDLKTYLASLAIDPDLFSEFVADPGGAAKKARLSSEDQATLLSGDQGRIYVALQDQRRIDSK